MAEYRFNIKVKTKAQDICQKAAYNAREQFVNEETGHLTKQNWKNENERFIGSGITLSSGAPERLRDRATLWNEVNNLGNAYNSRLARSIELNIPNELTDIEGIKLVQDYALSLAKNEGMIVDWAIHRKKNNFHAHLLIPDRQYKNNKWQIKAVDSYECINNQTGEIKNFRKVSELNTWNKNNPENQFERQPLLDEEGNQKYRVRKGKGKEKLYKKQKIDLTGWNSTDKLIEWRKSWEIAGNKALEKYNTNWTCESYDTIFKDLDPELRPQPQQHLGLKQNYIEKKEQERCKNAGLEYKPITKTAQVNQAVQEHNSLINKLINLLKQKAKAITEKTDIYSRFLENRGKMLTQTKQKTPVRNIPNRAPVKRKSIKKPTQQSRNTSFTERTTSVSRAPQVAPGKRRVKKNRDYGR